jgi:thiamine-phosphate pyrophosphorylase
LKLSLPCLMLVTDRRRCAGRPLVELVRRAVAAGVDAVQLREKDLPDDELWDLAVALRRVTAARCPLLINSRLDVALAAGADGVHLPERGLPIAAVRRLAPRGFLIGRSVHSAEGARRAEVEGADYVLLGTIFATESKPDKEPDGLGLVRQATAGLGIPCLAVGGIVPANAASVLEAGAQGVAAVSAILGAVDVEAAVLALRRHLDGAGVVGTLRAQRRQVCG